MERNAIKSVAFGGFDKGDVARYIEQASKEAEALKAERDALSQQRADLEREAAVLREQVQRLTEEREQLAAQVERLAEAEAESTRLRQQLEALRPDAEAHAMLREQLGSIECEARRRAAELEEQTTGQMKQATDLFRQQYQVLMSTFETASAHMKAELRKMEVSLTQLPRTMDQTGTELNRLAATLEKAGKTDESA